ncbi:TIGR02556 family CRISPR-associated protein [Fuchsiella alkaliacetigena]|nr:TIGR02556 family CRISPR-associated protein [Fuchsiella alkaliacetigena]
MKSIGDYKRESSDQDLLAQIVDNPNSRGSYNTVLVIAFKEEAAQIVFDKVVVEDFSKEKLTKYAYKYGSPRGGDLTPTSKLTDLEKTFQRIQRPLQKIYSRLKGKKKSEEIILAIYEQFQEQQVASKIYNRLAEIKYSDEAILTIAFKNKDSTLKYVGDFQEFVELLMESYEKQFYYKSSYLKQEQKSIGENNLCYICSQQADKTYGYVGTFSFYTLDKPGFTTGGFNRQQAWRNYPVCPKCAKALSLGRKYLENKLKTNLCGIDYFIIPKTIFNSKNEDKQELFKILEYLNQVQTLETKTEGKNLTNAKKDFFRSMSELENFISFNLLFYEQQNSAFRILLYVENITPTYLRRIFAVKERVEEEELFKNLAVSDASLDLKFKLELIANFFYINREHKLDFTTEFLEIISSIFTGQRLSEALLMERFADHLQEKFRAKRSIWSDTLKAVMILKFLQQLELLNWGEQEVEGCLKFFDEIEFPIINFLAEQSDVLDSKIKQLIFLQGLFTQKILNLQKKEYNGIAPFRDKLNGLKLNQKLLEDLHPELFTKLNDYLQISALQLKKLKKLMTDLFVDSDFNSITNNKLSFYFAFGMSQATKLQPQDKRWEVSN